MPGEISTLHQQLGQEATPRERLEELALRLQPLEVAYKLIAGTYPDFRGYPDINLKNALYFACSTPKARGVGSPDFPDASCVSFMKAFVHAMLPEEDDMEVAYSEVPPRSRNRTGGESRYPNFSDEQLYVISVIELFGNAFRSPNPKIRLGYGNGIVDRFYAWGFDPDCPEKFDWDKYLHKLNAHFRTKFIPEGEDTSSERIVPFDPLKNPFAVRLSVEDGTNYLKYTRLGQQFMDLSLLVSLAKDR